MTNHLEKVGQLSDHFKAALDTSDLSTLTSPQQQQHFQAIVASCYSAKLQEVLLQYNLDAGGWSRETFKQYIIQTASLSPRQTEQMLFHLYAVAAHRADHPLHSLSHVMLPLDQQKQLVEMITRATPEAP